MSQSNTPWDAHLELLSRICSGRPSGATPTTPSAVISASDIHEALRSEWNARPVGCQYSCRATRLRFPNPLQHRSRPGSGDQPLSFSA
jgi:hypothetical protein